MNVIDAAQLTWPDAAPAGRLAGFRAEDVVLGVSDGGHLALDATVEALEPTGGDVLLHLGVGADRVVARVSRHTGARPGDVVRLGVPCERVVTFDAATGVRVDR
jgi:sn-glycerol 3-phosphate transport system ATP-binding protein